MKYYIGVDGGGTKTAFALFNENKEMLEYIEGPGSNHENLESSFDGASDIIIAEFPLCQGGYRARRRELHAHGSCGHRPRISV